MPPDVSIECIVKGDAIIGEGPLWVPSESCLYWFDSLGRKLNKHIPGGVCDSSVELPEIIGSFTLRTRGGALIALASGIYFMDLTNNQLTPVFQPEGYGTDIRFNDGKCDLYGRFFVGSMDEKSQKLPVGALYRLDVDHSVTVLRRQVILGNGLGWSPDYKIMYFTDSKERRIYAFDYHLEDGSISNERVFAEDPSGWLPDGLTVDAEGCVWSAKFNAGQIVKYAPGGKVIKVVKLPVPRPTSVIFGGEDFKTLYITTARIGLNPAQLKAYPLSGSLLGCNVGVSGLPEPLYGG